MDDTLRQEVKLLKVYKDISYKELSQHLGIKPKSFYNWLHGEYDFSEKTADKLHNICMELMGT